jgi:transcriptional regulator with XRE-family HTH domain
MRKPIAKLPSKDAIQLGFGAAVRGIRESKKLTQEQLAELSDVHVTYVSQIERGLKNISLFNVHRIAYGLGVTAGQLLVEAEGR